MPLRPSSPRSSGSAPGFRDRVIGQTISTTSQLAAHNLNFVGGQTVPNLVIVRLSAMRDCAVAPGALDFYNLAGTVHVIVDVFGYFTNDEAVIA